MLNFPEVKGADNIPAPKMSLRDYAHFSAFCLENNSHCTPENCLDRDTGELDMKEPFRLDAE